MLDNDATERCERMCDEAEKALHADAIINRMLTRQPVTVSDKKIVSLTLRRTMKALRVARRRHISRQKKVNISDERLCAMASMTDFLSLKPYERLLHLVPRTVNVVTLAEATPLNADGTLNIGATLDLMHIATHCSTAYYAPKRFAAVQLAYDNPRSRVLVFHTGRFVGTGTRGPLAARLAIIKAQRQLAEEANVHVRITKFDVINSVGAVSLNATLDCDAFASAHSSTSHFDRDSFVGLAWRPPGESICCEIYSTGRANLPGAVREDALVRSFSRMLGEISRFSSQPQICDMLPADIRDVHRTRDLTYDEPTNSNIDHGNVSTKKVKKRKDAIGSSVEHDSAFSGGELDPELTSYDPWDGWTEA